MISVLSSSHRRSPFKAWEVFDRCDDDERAANRLARLGKEGDMPTRSLKAMASHRKRLDYLELCIWAIPQRQLHNAVSCLPPPDSLSDAPFLFAQWIMWIEGLNLVARVKGAIRRMVMRKLSLAWEKWQHEHEENKRQKMYGVLNRMLQRQLATGWTTWKAWYDGIMANRRRLIGGVVKRMRNKQLSMGWEQWQAWYEGIKRQQFKLSGALTRMRNRQLSMGWEKWQEWYAIYTHQLRLLRTSALRLIKRQLAMGWTTYYEWYCELKNQLVLVGGALNRMKKRQLSMAWERWQEWYEEMMEQRRKLDVAWFKMQNRLFAKAYNSWRQYYIDKINLRNAGIHFSLSQEWYGETFGKTAQNRILRVWRAFSSGRKEGQVRKRQLTSTGPQIYSQPPISTMSRPWAR